MKRKLPFLANSSRCFANFSDLLADFWLTFLPSSADFCWLWQRNAGFVLTKVRLENLHKLRCAKLADVLLEAWCYIQSLRNFAVEDVMHSLYNTWLICLSLPSKRILRINENAFCRNPRGIFPSKFPGDFCGRFILWILGLFPFDRKEERSTQNSTAKLKSEFGSFAAKMHTASWPWRIVWLSFLWIILHKIKAEMSFCSKQFSHYASCALEKLFQPKIFPPLSLHWVSTQTTVGQETCCAHPEHHALTMWDQTFLDLVWHILLSAPKLFLN